jgi:hypothetical protein
MVVDSNLEGFRWIILDRPFITININMTLCYTYKVDRGGAIFDVHDCSLERVFEIQGVMMMYVGL